MTEQWFVDKVEEFEKDAEFLTEEAILSFTEDVAAKMKELGISRVELARRLGVSKAFITKVLNGSPNLTIKTMVALAGALECELKIAITSRSPAKAPTYEARDGNAYLHEEQEKYSSKRGKKS